MSTHERVPAPAIPGTDGENVMAVGDAHSGARGPVGHHVVIAGGGLSGADLALELADDGHEVTIVERTDVIAADLHFPQKISLLRGLMENHVRLMTGHTVTAVDEDGLTAVGAAGEVHVDADTVVIALGAPRAPSADSPDVAGVHAIGA